MLDGAERAIFKERLIHRSLQAGNFWLPLEANKHYNTQPPHKSGDGGFPRTAPELAQDLIRLALTLGVYLSVSHLLLLTTLRLIPSTQP